MGQKEELYQKLNEVLKKIDECSADAVKGRDALVEEIGVIKHELKFSKDPSNNETLRSFTSNNYNPDEIMEKEKEYEEKYSPEALNRKLKAYIKAYCANPLSDLNLQKVLIPLLVELKNICQQLETIQIYEIKKNKAALEKAKVKFETSKKENWDYQVLVTKTLGNIQNAENNQKLNSDYILRNSDATCNFEKSTPCMIGVTSKNTVSFAINENIDCVINEINSLNNIRNRKIPPYVASKKAENLFKPLTDATLLAQYAVSSHSSSGFSGTIGVHH